MSKHLIALLIFLITAQSAAEPLKDMAFNVPNGSMKPFYQELIKDLAKGKPLRITLYVALCDNSQGIAPVKNKRICMGDKPEQNLYWAAFGGVRRYLQKQKFKRILYRSGSANSPIIITSVWRKVFSVRGKLSRKLRRYPVEVIALAYRGTKIEDAMRDYLNACLFEPPKTLLLDDGTKINYGKTSHIVGYIGHNYLLEVDAKSLVKNLKSTIDRHNVIFGLSCLGTKTIGSIVKSKYHHLMLFNKSLTFPGAWPIGGMIRAILAGKSPKEIRYQAGKAKALAIKRRVRSIVASFSYSP